MFDPVAPHLKGDARHKARCNEPSENVPENDPIENSSVPAYATPRFPEKAEPALNHHSVSSTPSAGRQCEQTSEGEKPNQTCATWSQRMAANTTRYT